MLFAAPALQAETMTYSADLTGADEVPPNDSTATGHVEVKLDTEAKTVTWTYSSDGLTGPATASHIHGPADATENADPLVDTSAGEEGTADASDDTVAALKDGKAYFNIHTEKYPDGEIRGQLAAADEAGMTMDSDAADSDAAAGSDSMEEPDSSQ